MLGDGGWRLRASCAGVDPALFYTERGESTADAKAVCAGCGVRAECLDYALTYGESRGVWGGLSERERRQLRRTAERPATSARSRPPLKHGTVYGYQTHLRRGIPACVACTDANRRYQQGRQEAS